MKIKLTKIRRKGTGIALLCRTRRVDIQVSIMTALMVTISCLCVYFFHYQITYTSMIRSLSERVASICDYVEDYLDKDTFQNLRSPADMSTDSYQENQRLLRNVRLSTGVRYLYTATRKEDGTFIYLLDGLPLNDSGTPEDPEDFRSPGDVIEPEIIPELEQAMSGQAVLPSEIKDTGWGKIFISYLPVHDGDYVAGVVGVEFEAESEYNTYRALRLITPLIIVTVCVLSLALALLFFRRISNPSYRDLANTDQLTQLKSRNAFTFDLHNWEPLREKTTLGILLADLNNLKQVNDTLGHEVGDEYLRLAARALSGTGQTGVAYRVGGDEFALLLPDASEEILNSLTERIEQDFARIRPGDWPVDTSISLGWALFNASLDADLQSTFRRADEAMYLKKRTYHSRRHSD